MPESEVEFSNDASTLQLIIYSPAATDKSHYENVPFEIPKSWCWTSIGELFEHNTGKALNASNRDGKMMDYITTSNLYWDRFDLSVVKQMLFTEE